MSDTPDTKPTALRGHRELTLAEQAAIAEVDVLGDQLQTLLNSLEARSDINKRDLAIARTKLQTGLMWLTRSIAKPTRF